MPNNDNISKLYGAYSQVYDNFKNEDEFRDYVNNADDNDIQNLFNDFSAEYDNFDKDGIEGFKQYVGYTGPKAKGITQPATTVTGDVDAVTGAAQQAPQQPVATDKVDQYWMKFGKEHGMDLSNPDSIEQINSLAENSRQQFKVLPQTMYDHLVKNGGDYKRMAQEIATKLPMYSAKEIEDAFVNSGLWQKAQDTVKANNEKLGNEQVNLVKYDKAAEAETQNQKYVATKDGKTYDVYMVTKGNTVVPTDERGVELYDAYDSNNQIIGQHGFRKGSNGTLIDIDTNRSYRPEEIHYETQGVPLDTVSVVANRNEFNMAKQMTDAWAEKNKINLDVIYPMKDGTRMLGRDLLEDVQARYQMGIASAFINAYNLIGAGSDVNETALALAKNFIDNGINVKSADVKEILSDPFRIAQAEQEFNQMLVDRLDKDEQITNARLNKSLGNIQNAYMKNPMRTPQGDIMYEGVNILLAGDNEAKADLARLSLIREMKQTLEAGFTGKDKGWVDQMTMAIRHGLSDALFDQNYASQSLLSAQEEYKAIEKVRAGKGTDEDKALVDLYALKGAVEQRFGDNIGMVYKLQKDLGYSLPFIVQAGLSSGTGIAKFFTKGGEKAGTKVAEKVMGKFLTNEMSQQMISRGIPYIGKGIGYLTGATLEALAQTFAFGLKDINADAVTRMIGNVGMVREGNKLVAQFGDNYEDGKKAKTVWEAFRQAAVNDFNGRYSEYLGELFAPIRGILGSVGVAGVKGVSKGLGKAGFKEMGDWLVTLTNKDLTFGLNNFLKTIKFHGTIGEYGEEVLNNVLNAIEHVDMNFVADPNDPNFDKSVWNPDTNLETFLSCAYMTGIFGVAAGVNNEVQRNKCNNICKQQGAYLEQALGTQKWNQLQANLASANMEDVGIVVTDALKSIDGDEAKNAYYQYATASLALEGMDQGALRQAVEDTSVADKIEQLKKMRELGRKIEELYNRDQMYNTGETIETNVDGLTIHIVEDEGDGHFKVMLEEKDATAEDGKKFTEAWLDEWQINDLNKVPRMPKAEVFTGSPDVKPVEKVDDRLTDEENRLVSADGDFKTALMPSDVPNEDGENTRKVWIYSGNLVSTENGIDVANSDNAIIWMDDEGNKYVGSPLDFVKDQQVQTVSIDNYIAERDAEELQQEVEQNAAQQTAAPTETATPTANTETQPATETPATPAETPSAENEFYQDETLVGDEKNVDGNRLIYDHSERQADGTIVNAYRNGVGAITYFPATENQTAEQAVQNASAELEQAAQQQKTAKEVADEGISFNVGEEHTGHADVNGTQTNGTYYIDKVNEDGTIDVSFEDATTGDISQMENLKPSELNAMLDNPVSAEKGTAQQTVTPEATAPAEVPVATSAPTAPAVAQTETPAEPMTPAEQTLAADAQAASSTQEDLIGVIEDAGGDYNIAAQDIQATIEDLQKNLEEVGKRVAKRVSRAAGNEQALAERRQALAEQRDLQQQLAHWQDVQDALNEMMNAVAEVETPAVAEAPAVAETPAPATNTTQTEESAVAETPTTETPVNAEPTATEEEATESTKGEPTTTETTAEKPKAEPETAEQMNERVAHEIDRNEQREQQTQTNQSKDRIKKMRDKADLLINLAHQFGLNVVFDENQFKNNSDRGHQEGRTLVLNPNANIVDNVKAILGHEMTHTVEGKNEAYKKLTQFAMHSKTFQDWIKTYVSNGRTHTSLQDAAAGVVAFRERYARQTGINSARVTMQQAVNEIFADFFGEKLFADDNFVKSMMRNVPETRGFIRKFIDAIRELIAGLTGRVDTSELKQMADMMEDCLNQMSVEEADTKHSIDTFGESLGFKYNKDENTGATILTDDDGNPITEFSVQRVKESLLGAMIGQALQDGRIDSDMAEKQCQFFSDLVNMMIKTKDIDMVYAVSSQVILMDINQAQRRADAANKRMDEEGSIRQRERIRDYERNGINGVVAQAGITANADPQYSVTIDWTTICTKTQSIINTMSQVMKDRKRGLTSDEIVEIVYDEVHKGGEQTPCPVCYVFSRWLNLGKLFDNMAELQAKYGDKMDEFVAKYGQEALKDEDKVKEWQQKQAAAIAKRYREVQKAADQMCEQKAKEEPDAFKNVKDAGDRRKKYIKLIEDEYYTLQQKHNEKLMNKKAKALTSAERKRLRELEQQMQLINEYSWFSRVRLSFGKDGKIKPMPGYKDIPLNVLYDINASEEFSTNYPLQWGYRTTRGSGMGKASYSYSPMHVGQVIMGTNNVKSALNLKNNPFLHLPEELDENGYRKMDKKALDKLAAAKKKAIAQNWLNGQRLQSTSDFRFEFGLDYLMAQLEEQTLGAYEQMYMKVPEGAPFMAETGAEINLSLVGKGSGFVPVSRTEMYEHPENHPFAIEVDGDFYELVFSKVTGIDPRDAFDLADTYDNVQPILIGFSPTHMRVAMRDSRITFIIPYHSSGLAEARYEKMMQALGELEDGRIIRDFSPFQNDLMFVSGEEVKLDDNGDPVEKDGDVVMVGVKAKKLPQADWEAFWERHSDKIAQYISPEFLLDDNGQPLSQEALFDRMSQTRKLRTKLFSEADNLLSHSEDGVISDEQIAEVFTPEDMKLIGMHPMLAKIFNMLYQDTDNMYYGMTLKKAQQQLIMSHEYWDESTIYGEDDYKNSERFIAYSLSMGAMPRFSGWVNKSKGDADIQYIPDMDYTDEVGYWKTLIDRSMYNTAKNGDPATRNKYHEQRAVNLSALTQPSKYGDSAGVDLIGFREDENGNPVSARTIQRQEMNARRPEGQRGTETQQFAKEPGKVQDMANKSAARIEAKHEATAQRAKDLLNFYFNNYESREGGLSTKQKDKINKRDAVDMERLLDEYQRTKGEGGLYASGNVELESLVDGLATAMGMDMDDEANSEIVPNYEKAKAILATIKNAVEQSNLNDKTKKALLKSVPALDSAQATIEKWSKEDAKLGIVSKATAAKMKAFAKGIIDIYDNANGEVLTNKDNLSNKVGKALHRDFNEEYDRGIKHSIAPEVPVAEPGESPIQFAKRMADYRAEVQEDIERKAEFANDGGAKHSIVEDPEILAEYEPQLSDSAKEMPVAEVRRRLEAGEPLGKGYVTLYRAMRQINGRLFSPKMSKLAGKGNEIFLGKIEQSDERPEIAKPKTMADGSVKYKVDLDGSDPTGSGLKRRTTPSVDYNPYLHCSTSMLNDQFTAAYDMPEMVVVEVRVPLSHLESGYKADKAASSVGFEPWRSGHIDNALPANEKRGVCLTSYDKPIRVVPENVVLDNIAALLKRNNLSIPFNLVTPSVAEGLVRRGVEVTDKVFGIKPSEATKEWEKRWAEQRAKIDGTDPDDPNGGGGKHSISEDRPSTRGVAYQGTKNWYADDIVDLLPEGTRFVDLFSGGGAMTDAALDSGKFDTVHMNDLFPMGQRLFLDAVDGKYHDYNREVTPEEFKSMRFTSEGVLHSFNGYGRNVANMDSNGRSKQQEQIRRAQKLERFKPMRDKIESSEVDYRDVEIRPGDVLYADIPYDKEDVSGYAKAGKFDHKAFAEWAANLDQPVYVSSYEAPEGFTEIWHASKATSNGKVEKVFVQDKFAKQAKAIARKNQKAKAKHSIDENDPWADWDAENESKRQQENETLASFGLQPKGKNLPWVQDLALMTPEDVQNMSVFSSAWTFRKLFNGPEAMKTTDVGNDALRQHVDELYEAARQKVYDYAMSSNTIGLGTMTENQAKDRIDDIDYTARQRMQDSDPFFKYFGKVMLQANEANKEALANGTLARAPKGHNVGFDYGEITHKDVDALFKSLNGSKTLGKLYKKVAAITRKLDIPFYVTNLRNAAGESFYSGHIEFDYDYFNNEDISDQEKASTLLHELIHQATTYALDTFEYGNTMLDADMVRACKEIKALWRQVRKNAKENGITLWQSGYGDYATKDVNEYVAEMANPGWREKLKAAGLWEKAKAAIKRLFKLDAPENNTEERMAKLLDYVLDNFDEMAYWNFRNNHSGSNASNRDVDTSFMTEEQEHYYNNVTRLVSPENTKPFEDYLAEVRTEVGVATNGELKQHPKRADVAVKARELYGYERQAVGQIPADRLTDKLLEVLGIDATDNTVGCPAWYFIEHWFIAHQNLNEQDAVALQECLTYGECVNTVTPEHRSVVFRYRKNVVEDGVEKARWYGVSVQVNEDGELEFKNLMKQGGQNSKKPAKNGEVILPGVEKEKALSDTEREKMSLEARRPSIVTTASSGEFVSALNDGAKVNQNSDTAKQNGENLSSQGQNLTVEPGKHSISEEQIHSDNFKRWFGDWENDPENASKVVDENGKPLVVYHGTRGDFNVFETGKTGRRWAMGFEYPVQNQGFFFSPDYMDAEDYAAQANGNGEKRVVEAYINMRHPADLSELTNESEELFRDIVGMYPSEYNQLEHDVTDWWHIADKNNDEYDIDLPNRLKELGYDGIIFREKNGEKSYFVLDSTQIKSATDNNGNFDGSNPDIRHSITEEEDAAYMDAVNSGDMETVRRMVTEAAKKAMPNTKVVDRWGKPKLVYHGTPKGTFNVFNGDYQFFTSKESVAKEYRYLRGALAIHSTKEGHVMPVFLNIENPLVLDVHGRWSAIKPAMVENALGKKIEQTENLDTEDVCKIAKENGYDGVIFKNINDHVFNDFTDQSDVYVTFSPNQIKSSGATYRRTNEDMPSWWQSNEIAQRYGATFDDNGNVIPLSERFNPASNDIRHSVDENAEPTYEERIANAFNAAQKAINTFAANGNSPEAQEEGRKAVSSFIRTALSKDDMPQIGKLQLTRIMALVRDVKNARMLNKHLIAAQDIVATAEQSRLLQLIDYLLKLRKQGRNSKGVSIAKTVDDRTRMLFDFMKGQTRELLDTPIQEEIDAVNQKIRENKQEIASLELDRSNADVQTRIAQLEQDNKDLLAKKQELFEKRNEQRDQNIVDAMRDWEARLAELESRAGIIEGDTMDDSQKPLTDAEFDELEGLTILKMINDARLIAVTGLKDENGEQQKGIKQIEKDKAELKAKMAQLRADLHDASTADKKAIRQQMKALDAQITNCDVMINALKDQQVDLLRQACESLNELVENGRQKLKEELQEENLRRQRIVKNTLDDIWKGKHSKEGQESGDKSKWRQLFDTFLLRPSLSFEFMSQWLSNRIGGRGYLYRKFTRDLIKSEENFATNIDESTEKLNQACRQFFGCDFKTAAVRFGGKPKKTGIHLVDTETGERVETEVEMNKGTALQFWMWWQNSDGQMKMRAMGYNEDSIIDLERFIGPDLIKFGNFLFDFYREMGDRVNEVHKMLYHTSMRRPDYYSPLKIDKRDVKDNTNMSEGENKFSQTLNKVYGSHINRTVNTKRLSYLHTAFDIVSQHVQDQEEFIAFSRVRKDLDYMLSSPAVHKVLNANKTGQYDDFLEAAMVAAHLSKFDATALDKGISAIMSGFAGGAIGWRLWTGCKQIMSYPAFYAYKGDLQFAKDVTARFFSILQAKPKVWMANIDWAKNNLPLFKARWNEGLAGNQDVLREIEMMEDSGKLGQLMAKYSGYGMLWNRFVDAMTCAAGARAIYDFEYRRIKKALVAQGMPAEQAHKQAHNEALMCANNYNTTQQSTVKTFISADQDSKTLANRVFGLFQNSNRGFTRQGYIGARDILKALKTSNRKKWIMDYQNDFNVSEKEAERMLNEDIRSAVNKFIMCGFGIKWIWDRTQGLGKAALLAAIGPGGGALLGAGTGAMIGASVGSRYGHAGTGTAIGGIGGGVAGGAITGATAMALKNIIKLFVEGMMDDGDDDDDKTTEKQSIAYHLMMFGMKSAGFYAQGSPAGNFLHDIIWSQRYSSPMSILGTNELSMAERAYEKYGVSPAVYGACANIGLAWGGLKMDTWSSIVMGTEDLIRQGEDADIAMDVMLILNCPKSMRVDVAKDMYGKYSPAEYARVMAKANKIIEDQDNEFLNNLLYTKSLDPKKKKEFIVEWMDDKLDPETRSQFKAAEDMMKDVSKHMKGGRASKKAKASWKEANSELIESGRADNLKTIKSALGNLNKCLIADVQKNDNKAIDRHAAQASQLKQWAVNVMNGKVYDQNRLNEIAEQAKAEQKNNSDEE